MVLAANGLWLWTMIAVSSIAPAFWPARVAARTSVPPA